MKCEKCNAKIKKDDVFCPECGYNLRKKESVFNKFCEWIYSKRICIFVILIVIVLLICLFNILSYLFGPRFISSKYMCAIKNNNYEEIFKLSGVKKTDLVNTKVLKEKMTSYDIDEYKYDGIEEYSDGTYVRYLYTKNNEKYTIYVKLIKGLNKNFLIFDNYNIISGQLADNVKIKLPLNSEVKLDNKDISKYKKIYENYDLYEFDYLIKGNYKLDIKLPNGQELSEEVEIESNGIYSINNFELDKDTKSKLISELNETLNKLYNGSINNVNYNESGLAGLMDEYKELKSYIQTNDSKLNSISFNDINVEYASYNDKLNVVYNVGCNYSISYTLNDETKTYDGMGYIDIEVSYNYNDGKYEIENISNFPKRFQIR